MISNRHDPWTMCRLHASMLQNNEGAQRWRVLPIRVPYSPGRQYPPSILVVSDYSSHLFRFSEGFSIVLMIASVLMILCQVSQIMIGTFQIWSMSLIFIIYSSSFSISGLRLRLRTWPKQSRIKRSKHLLQEREARQWTRNMWKASGSGPATRTTSYSWLLLLLSHARSPSTSARTRHISTSLDRHRAELRPYSELRNSTWTTNVRTHQVSRKEYHVKTN